VNRDTSRCQVFMLHARFCPFEPLLTLLLVSYWRISRLLTTRFQTQRPSPLWLER
jgi:hypothetical protein